MCLVKNVHANSKCRPRVTADKCIDYLKAFFSLFARSSLLLGIYLERVVFLSADNKLVSFSVPSASCLQGVTVSGKCCKFPFIYKGKKYKSCTDVDYKGKFWCSLTSNYRRDKKWGRCKGETSFL